MAERTLRLVSWNIHGGVGRDGRRDLERIGRILNGFGADCLALQEVENLRIGAIGQTELSLLAEMAGLSSVAGPTLLRPDGDYGNAVLTRWPVQRVVRHDISVAGREPRGVLQLQLAIDGQPLEILATHLGLDRRERHWQLAKLRSLSEGGGDALALLGDLNVWQPGNRALRDLRSVFLPLASLATFPSGWPVLALDRILLKGVKQPRLRTLRDAEVRHASDHLPLIAEFQLPSKSSPRDLQ